jgi:hypothetical protein
MQGNLNSGHPPSPGAAQASFNSMNDLDALVISRWCSATLIALTLIVLAPIARHRTTVGISRVRTGKARALGFISAGLAIAVLGFYIDYLVFTGQWWTLWEGRLNEPKEYIVHALMPILFPLGGLATFAYGLLHMFSRKPPRGTRSNK